MVLNTDSSKDGGWLEASGFLQILRTLGLAIHSTKLGIALTAIVLTFALGMVLDAIWRTSGGVQATAITQFINARELDQPYDEKDGDFGIFHTWRVHERQCVRELLGSSLPGGSAALGTPLGNYITAPGQSHPLRSLIGIVGGVRWMVECHTVYFILFAIGMLLIWSYCGGAICRIAAVQFARDERLSMRQALSYARGKLFGGFFLAPCIPLFFIALGTVCLVIGGMFLRLPILGDILGGLAFGLALFAGFLISILLIGLMVGGNLFWPAVATEGADAFDAFSRGLAYPFSKPLKTILYAIIAVVFASLCWVFVNLFTYLMLAITRGAVAFGTSPFGWWSRGAEGEAVRKLDLLWPLEGPNSLYSFPDWSNLTVFEHVSAALIGFFVLLVIGLMWSFLASFYFSGCTVIYMLLRRDVDGTDLEEIYEEEVDENAEPGAAYAADAPHDQTPSSQTDTGAPSSGAISGTGGATPETTGESSDTTLPEPPDSTPGRDGEVRPGE